MVYDLTNRKSQQNLHKWLAEILMKDGKEPNNEYIYIIYTIHCFYFTFLDTNNNKLLFSHSYNYDPEFFSDSHIPILVVGSKVDQWSSNKDMLPMLKATSLIADECGADQFNIVSKRSILKIYRYRNHPRLQTYCR